MTVSGAGRHIADLARPTLRRRLLLGLVAVSFGSWFVLVLGIILNARLALEQEVEASFGVANRLVAERIARIRDTGDPSREFALLARQIDDLRHVEVHIVAHADASQAVRRAANDSESPPSPGLIPPAAEADTPRWFAWLIKSQHLQSVVPVNRDGVHQASIRIASDESDEIDEVWRDFRFFLPLTIVYGAVLSAVAYWIADTILRRLAQTSRALYRLRRGDSGVRLPEARFEEFIPVIRGFNDLAASLDAKTRDNQDLAARLLTAHDEERRRLANELHDDLGPNLFAVRANLSALKDQIPPRGDAVTCAIAEAAETVDASLANSQAIVRRIIAQLKPVSIGKRPLAESIDNLIGDFRRTIPGFEASFSENTRGRNFGEIVDLTVHRFVGETIMNAVRHGEATRVTIRLDAGERELDVSVSDNGTGPAQGAIDGVGLSAVHDRVETLGGRVEGPKRTGATTTVAVTIPTGSTARPAPCASRAMS